MRGVRVGLIALRATTGPSKVSTSQISSTARILNEGKPDTNHSNESDAIQKNQKYLEDVATGNSIRFSQVDEDDGGRVVSRDMNEEAESSRSPWINELLKGSPNINAEEPASSPFSPKPTITTDAIPTRPSLADSLTPDWNADLDPSIKPRIKRGIHDRRKRESGTTPHEHQILTRTIKEAPNTNRAKLADTIMDILQKLDKDMLNNKTSSSSGTHGLFDVKPKFYHPSSSDSEQSIAGTNKYGRSDSRYQRSEIREGQSDLRGTGSGSLDEGRVGELGIPYSRLRQVTEVVDREVEDDLVTYLDTLKEQLGDCQTDYEVLEWAKEKVLKPLEVEQLPSQSSTVDKPRAKDSEPPIITFHPSYPRILGHLLSYIRTYFNNPYLVLAIFHHAQTSSGESYLSGCLAPAYNEVLKVKWESFRDLKGISELIKEMDMNGVGWDQKTMKFIDSVLKEVGNDIFGDYKPEQVGKVVDWKVRYGEDCLSLIAGLEERLSKDFETERRRYEYEKREQQRKRDYESRISRKRGFDNYDNSHSESGRGYAHP